MPKYFFFIVCLLAGRQSLKKSKNTKFVSIIHVQLTLSTPFLGVELSFESFSDFCVCVYRHVLDQAVLPAARVFLRYRHVLDQGVLPAARVFLRVQTRVRPGRPSSRQPESFLGTDTCWTRPSFQPLVFLRYRYVLDQGVLPAARVFLGYRPVLDQAILPAAIVFLSYRQFL